MDTIMVGIEHTQEALTVFADWAERVRKKTGDTPRLQIYADGSGSVAGNVIYFAFRDISTLLERLNKLQASKQFARPRV